MNSALFLDRDGVINVDHGYVHTPEKTTFVEGIFELVARANAISMKVVVVTNQAGIARGLYTEVQFLAYMEWVKSRFLAHGAKLDAIYYCPHHPVHGLGVYLKTCMCRKPAPGMFHRALADMDLDATQSIMVGDQASDMLAAQRAGLSHLYHFEPNGIACANDDSNYIKINALVSVDFNV